MMAAHWHEWVSLLIRWAHFITGVAWIGASFYFNWLENHLERQTSGESIDDDPIDGDPISGDLWAVHGGGFYYLQKYRLAPEKLPATLHWFKWEAYATWLTGFALLCVVYYWNATAYMLNPGTPGVSASLAVVAGITSLLLSWFLYDALCRSSVSRHGLLTGVLIFAWFVLLAWLLNQVLSGRAVFIHVGAAIGTIMVANVFRVIIPSQKELVDAVAENRRPNPAFGRQALQRSRHNNYFTLPVLFMMISSHYAMTWSHAISWLVLALISLSAIGVRHYFNVRHLPNKPSWLLLVSLLPMLLAVWLTSPVARSVRNVNLAAPETSAIMPVIKERCSGCHSSSPATAGFASAPLGILLDESSQVEGHAERIHIVTTQSRTMPLGNLTGMTEQERELIGSWYQGRK
jgi:uncharacterized membrane protein